MQCCTSLARRFLAAAGLACAVLGSTAFGALGANPAPVEPLTGAATGAPAISHISVTPGGTDAWIEFTSSEPASAEVKVKAAILESRPTSMPTRAANPAPDGLGAGLLPSVVGAFGGDATPTPGPGDGVAGAALLSPIVGASGVDTISTPPIAKGDRFETSHRLHVTNLQPGTAYDATVSAETRSGTGLSEQAHFDTLQQRVRIYVDTIDITHGAAVFGDNEVSWGLAVDWEPGPGAQSIHDAGSTSTCFPSDGSGDPTRLVRICQEGSYGDGTFQPHNYRGLPLTWIFAQENFITMPTVFTVHGQAHDSDLLVNGRVPNPEYPGGGVAARGCSPENTLTIPQGAAAMSTFLAVCGDDYGTGFESLVTFRIEVFYDSASYPAPMRDAPTNPWS
jgi:hypothetical protein